MDSLSTITYISCQAAGTTCTWLHDVCMWAYTSTGIHPGVVVPDAFHKKSQIWSWLNQCVRWSGSPKISNSTQECLVCILLTLYVWYSQSPSIVNNLSLSSFKSRLKINAFLSKLCLVIHKNLPAFQLVLKTYVSEEARHGHVTTGVKCVRNVITADKSSFL